MFLNEGEILSEILIKVHRTLVRDSTQPPSKLFYPDNNNLTLHQINQVACTYTRQIARPLGLHNDYYVSPSIRLSVLS